MNEVSASIKLRPTRIGFLVRPTDTASIRKIMQACTCLWGGVFNPIIPVFRISPEEWRPEHPYEQMSGLAITKGYISFYEPDVYVESEQGLLERAGLSAIRTKHTVTENVVSLKAFLQPDKDRKWSEPQYGLGITDVFRHIYQSERKFKLRDEKPSIQVKTDPSNCLVEAVFGAYPKQSSTGYIAKGYKDVFAPREMKPDPKSWLEVFKRNALTPLGLTQYKLERTRYWYHDPVVFIFDPQKPTDLIDCWNLRLEPNPILPVPIEWFDSLAGDIRSFLEAEHRPIKGKPSDAMHHATVEFARTIDDQRRKQITDHLSRGLQKGALVVKDWRTPIWKQHTNDMVHQDRRMEVIAGEQQNRLTINEGNELTISFQALSPEFASRFSHSKARWMNVVNVDRFGLRDFASVLPFNLFDRKWPRLSWGLNQVTVGSEGWVFAQDHKNWNQTVTLLTKEDAIIGSLAKLEIDAKLSDPGHVARQMIEHLGGLRGVQLLADQDTLILLNKMAGGVRRKSNKVDEVEETFELRSAPVKTWEDLISKRNSNQKRLPIDLNEFTKRNVIRLGLETTCPQCLAKNWHSLTAVDYSITCDRCLNEYEFPQTGPHQKVRNWSYRVLGPFSVPDFGRGAYSALLTLKFLKEFAGSHSEMTFSTAMNLVIGDASVESDFIALWRDEKIDWGVPPQLVFGEAKSVGQGDLIKPDDIEKLRAIGERVPNAVLVVSVLRDQFNASEKRILTKFAKWCRRSNGEGQPTNHLVLLTSLELHMDFSLKRTWTELGEPYSNFADYHQTKNLHRLAESTQQIYLDLPSYYDWRAAIWKKRNAAKKKAAKKNS
ncbi:hypothetical protein [Pelagibius sp.]|uniref:hypothetical protein n=1 Tax=Pelagibius sp. TaxID=1931238 RepID=UPI003B50B37E